MYKCNNTRLLWFKVARAMMNVIEIGTLRRFQNEDKHFWNETNLLLVPDYFGPLKEENFLFKNNYLVKENCLVKNKYHHENLASIDLICHSYRDEKVLRCLHRHFLLWPKKGEKVSSRFHRQERRKGEKKNCMLIDVEKEGEEKRYYPEIIVAHDSSDEVSCMTIEIDWRWKEKKVIRNSTDLPMIFLCLSLSSIIMVWVSFRVSFQMMVTTANIADTSNNSNNNHVIIELCVIYCIYCSEKYFKIMDVLLWLITKSMYTF